MASFKDALSKDDVTAIHAYVIDQAHQAWDAKQKGKERLLRLMSCGLLTNW